MRPGDRAPDFTLPDQEGTPHTLSTALNDGPVVLFFYPAAMTKGCTAESCHFRDLGPDFTRLGAQRWGISMDRVATQRDFATANQLDYPLLSDEGGSVARQFGVKRALDILKVRRTTFVIAADQTVAAVVASEFSMEVHATRALETLRALAV
jgi:thioredoxin-dependent peroxiredoxin